MVKYPETNVLIYPMDYTNKRCLEDLKTYLEINGNAYHANCNNPKKKEYHYFMGNSSVFIEESLKRTNIRIIAHGQTSLETMKLNIENIFD